VTALVVLCAALALLAVYLVTDAVLSFPSAIDEFRPRTSAGADGEADQ